MAPDNPIIAPVEPPRMPGDRGLLIVDDDRPFAARLARAMEGRGYGVRVADSFAAGTAAVEACAPAFAVVDMRLGDGNGLDLIARLVERRPGARGVILTGYGSVAAAVAAVKRGAFDFLAKPADADAIHRALTARPGARPDPPEDPMSFHRVRWEHVNRAYELCGRNTSRAARRLAMHRRTLQGILMKRARMLRAA